MNIKKMIYLSLLTVIGIGVHILESSIPLPITGVPGMKLGLANIVNLVVLTIFGIREALIVGVLRCLMVVLLTGSVTSFFYSLSGAVLSTIVMFVVYKKLHSKFSLIGVSIFGSVAHNIGQLSVASMIIENVLIFTYLPILMLTSLFTGYFVGLSSSYVHNHFKKMIHVFKEKEQQDVGEKNE